MRLIDADGLWWYKLYDIDETGTSVAVNAVLLTDIDNAPTIDAVPVVRCKDCTEHQKCSLEQRLGWYGYCSEGERME